MLQIATPLPADIPLCATGHRPQLVETRGAPRGRIAGAIVPSHYHIECCQCRLATVPHISRAVAELRWTQPDNPNRIPLHHLPAARQPQPHSPPPPARSPRRGARHQRRVRPA